MSVAGVVVRCRHKYSTRADSACVAESHTIRWGAVTRILVVDDDTEVHPALQEALEAAGDFEVFMCSDPRAALSQAKLLRPDLIVLDVVMPVISGVEVAEQLRANRDTAAIPILYLTAFAGYLGPEGPQQHRVLSKPIRVQELLRAIRDAMQ